MKTPGYRAWIAYIAHKDTLGERVEILEALSDLFDTNIVAVEGDVRRAAKRIAKAERAQEQGAQQ